MQRAASLLSSLLCALAAAACGASTVFAQIEFEREPINYQLPTTHDPIARLQAALDAGETTLPYDEKHGYLPAVLKALAIPESSQALVFSKTSFQLSKITPSR